MFAFIQPRLVKNATVRPQANGAQTKSTPKPAPAPKGGTRFLDFLMSALSAPAA